MDRIEKVEKGEADMYEIILLDYSMPDIGGLAVAEAICKLVQEHHVRKPYICCCTAYNSKRHRDAALAAGCDRFITKPVTSDHITEIIEQTQQ